jgi:Fe-S-cluster containining protein
MTTSNVQTQSIAQLRILYDRIDQNFARIATKYPDSIHCGSGCFQCCAPNLTVSPIEAASIQSYVKGDAIAAKALNELKQKPAHGKLHCQLLGADGRCSIYAARPVVCRSHGIPLQYGRNDEATVSRSVCPLNFTESDVVEINHQDVMNMETVNTILATLNHAFSPVEKDSRIPLRPDSFFVNSIAKIAPLR